MASGEFYLGPSEWSAYNQKFQGKIVWSSVANEEENCSAVTASVYVRKIHKDNGAMSETYAQWGFSITIGEETTGEKHINARILNDWVLFGTLSNVVVHHEDNGAKAIMISSSVDCESSGVSFYRMNSKGSAEIQLDQIPRATAIGSISRAVCGENLRITWTPHRSDDSFRLSLSVGNWSHSLDVTPGSTKLYTAEVPIPLDEVAPQILQTSADLTVCLETLRGEVSLGSVTETVEVTVPETDATRPDIAMVLSGSGTFNDLLLQQRSSVTASITGTGKLGASIPDENVVLSVNGVPVEGMNTGILTQAGTVEITGRVTDSRGFSASATERVTVTAYFKPRVKNVSVYRCDENGNAKDDGTWLHIEATGEHCPITGNACRIWYRINNYDAETLQGSVTVEAGLDIAQSYQVTVGVTDTVGSSGQSVFMIPGVTVHNHKTHNGWGFGGLCDESGGMQVHWPARFLGEIYIGDKTLEEYIRSIANGG